MPLLELWVIYNKHTGDVYICKGKRFGLRVLGLMNKLFKLLGNKQNAIALPISSFFKNYPIDKELIQFTWKTTSNERMELFKIFQDLGTQNDQK